jgi:glutaminase
MIQYTGIENRRIEDRRVVEARSEAASIVKSERREKERNLKLITYLARHTFMINLIHVVLRYSTCCSMQKKRIKGIQ